MMSFKEQLRAERLPRHIAVIMDGNGRWAKEKGEIRLFGHRSGVEAVRDTVEACAELGIAYLTLYAFSSENWQRPNEEVQGLMSLLVETIQAELPTLTKNDIKLQAIGQLDTLPEQTRHQLNQAIEHTKNNQRMTLVLALSYSARQELVQACQELAQSLAQGQIALDDIDENLLAAKLSTAHIPDPELLIRTSGECRISNFLLWQIAYAELYFTPTFWPDFRREDLYRALYDYQNRERRFGMTSDQIQTSFNLKD